MARTISGLALVPFVVTWPVAGVMCALGYRYLLPAWQSRQTRQGEGWLIAALAVAGGFVFWR